METLYRSLAACSKAAGLELSPQVPGLVTGFLAPNAGPGNDSLVDDTA